MESIIREQYLGHDENAMAKEIKEVTIALKRKIRKKRRFKGLKNSNKK